MVDNSVREPPLNPVDQWRGIERLVALGWTEEADLGRIDIRDPDLFTGNPDRVTIDHTVRA